jgi:phosphopantothenoylcysteine decarboxylase/phosphopantothenate--cysteine ligase
LGAGGVHPAGPYGGPHAGGGGGAGRLIEPSEIIVAAEAALAAAGPLLGPRDLRNLRVLVSAGPTLEPIDDVRFVGNRSSGKMGFAVAAAAAERGASVTLLAGPGTPPTPPGVGARVDFETAADLGRALAEHAPVADVVVMAAAVADFRPAARVPGKLSRRAAPEGTALELVPNPDLLAGLARAAGESGRPRPFLVGFAAEVAGGDERALAERAAAKLREKGCDAIVANDVSQPGIGFSADENAGMVLFADGARGDVPRGSKAAFARQLWSLLAPRLRARAAAAGADGGTVHVLARR